MSQKIYRSAAGFVQQFGDKPAVETAQAAGKTVRRFNLRALGSDGTRISVTVWPDHDDTAINAGDFVAVEGELTTSSGQNQAGEPITYVNLSAFNLAVLAPAPKAAREVVNQQPQAAATPAVF